MGKVACQTIKVGKGVCGAAAERKETVLVKDVEEFPGHIACDGDSKSEIVVPVVVGDKVSAFPVGHFLSSAHAARWPSLYPHMVSDDCVSA